MTQSSNQPQAGRSTTVYTINVANCYGSEVWLPNGTRVDLPAHSTVRLPQRDGALADVSERIGDVTPCGIPITRENRRFRAFLLCPAVLEMPLQPCSPAPAAASVLHVPAGTVIIFGTPILRARRPRPAGSVSWDASVRRLFGHVAPPEMTTAATLPQPVDGSQRRDIDEQATP
ncbi:hypothetical protein MN608_10143 [Microdochium nivale]|nr:hypothetical protein MN608_10143 [Microdochium nivale]